MLNKNLLLTSTGESSDCVVTITNKYSRPYDVGSVYDFAALGFPSEGVFITTPPTQFPPQTKYIINPGETVTFVLHNMQDVIKSERNDSMALMFRPFSDFVIALEATCDCASVAFGPGFYIILDPSKPVPKHMHVILYSFGFD